MDTFPGDRSTAIFPSIAARQAHLKASSEYRKAAYYRRSEWLGFRIGRYEATVNHRAVIEKARKAGDHYAAVGRMLDQDMRNYRAMQAARNA